VRLGETAQADVASARDALGEREAAGRALERGLDLAEPDGLLFPFLLHPVPELLERHARQHTAHPALIRKIISVLGGSPTAATTAQLSTARSGGAACCADGGGVENRWGAMLGELERRKSPGSGAAPKRLHRLLIAAVAS
jgi:hypothetical protein